ncbi:MAG: mechanosensitive ion channel family protein [Bacteroidota bacterium]
MKKLIFFFLLITGFVNAQQLVKVDLRNPNATIYTHLYFLQPDSYDESKAALTIRGVSKNEAIDIAKKIKEVYEGKGLVVDFGEIPKDPDFLDTVSSVLNVLDKPLQRFVPFETKLPEIYVEKVGNKWYYSKESIEKIEKIYNNTFPWRFNWIHKNYPNFFEKKIGEIHIWKPIVLILLIAFCFLIYYILYPLFFYLLKKLQKLILPDKNYHKSFELLHEIARPLVFILITYFIDKYLPSIQLFKINNFLFLALDIAVTVFWIYFFIKLIKLFILLYSDFSKKTHTKLDEQLGPILYKLLLSFVVIIGLLHILTLFGVNPTTVIAGASIGGIAIAFAAQDSVKNLIGTINIFLDKPFRLGDWIEIGNIAGTVEKVGLRSTQIRAVDTSIHQIPNSKVSEADINNKGRRFYRRYNTELGIRYDTPPELIEAFVKGIREIIVVHPDTRSESYNVEFTGFGDSALLIMLNVFFKQLDWGAEQSSKHRLHIAIVKLAAALGVDFAFPSSTLMVEQFPEKESLDVKYNIKEKDINKSIQKVLDEFKGIDQKIDPNNSSISN